MPESEAEVEAVKAATRRFNARKGNFTLAENHLAGLIAKAEDLDSYSGTSISQMELGLNKLYDRFDELETMATQLTDLIADQELTDDFDPGEETNASGASSEASRKSLTRSSSKPLRLSMTWKEDRTALSAAAALLAQPVGLAALVSVEMFLPKGKLTGHG